MNVWRQTHKNQLDFLASRNFCYELIEVLFMKKKTVDNNVTCYCYIEESQNDSCI